jgi:hypothetical protein
MTSKQVNHFSLFDDEKSETIKANIRSHKYQNFKKVMPFITQAGAWLESSPMQTSFSFPRNKKETVIKVMKENDFIFNDSNSCDSKRPKKSFSLGYDEKSETITANVKSTDYDDFIKWMPFVNQSGKWMESYPMKTSFSFPRDKKETVISVMKEHSYEYKE